MIRVKVNEEEKASLNRLRRIQKSSQGERASYVLLSHAGKSVSEIANHVSRNEHTIRLWLKRYIREGISGLETRNKSGRPATKAPLLEAQLLELLDKTPQVHGYQEAGWQINLLRDWFEKRGLSVCENTLVKSLNKLGFVYKRFSKTVPKNTLSASEKKAGVGKLILEIKNKAQKEAIEIFFVDESHFSNQPYVSRGWFKRGEKK
ncbi:IS630 family transposase [Rickettsiella endosymbiont of Dermanyssus gallinae]|uniref:IS630 family transposase n=1 Tax=Rickettsiella endosymbiont of Dermanyssus gallinae TaxID=2856608 RepID=UPI001C533196|nr:IS630 family transposase [Rickettsiella endosymbiont of Dermanyssus gallinae]